MVLYLGRKACGLKLNELAEAAELKEYASVAMAVKRYGAHLKLWGPDRGHILKLNN